MNLIKNLTTALCLLVLFSCSLDRQTEESEFNHYIGTVTQSTNAVTLNTEFVDAWQKELIDQGIKTNLIDFKLMEDEYGLFIIGTNEDQSIRSSVFDIVQNSTRLFVNNNGSQLGPLPSTCTCKGCTNGCSPRRKESGDCYCTDCTSDQQECTKIESI